MVLQVQTSRLHLTAFETDGPFDFDEREVSGKHIVGEVGEFVNVMNTICFLFQLRIEQFVQAHTNIVRILRSVQAVLGGQNEVSRDDRAHTVVMITGPGDARRPGHVLVVHHLTVHDPLNRLQAAPASVVQLGHLAEIVVQVAFIPNNTSEYDENEQAHAEELNDALFGGHSGYFSVESLD